MQAWTAVQGTARDKGGRRGAHRGSFKICIAIKSEWVQSASDSSIAMEKEMTNPVNSVCLARGGSAAVKREMAVWMDPAHNEKQIP